MRLGEVNALAAFCKPSAPSVWRWVCTEGDPLASKWCLEFSQDLAWNNPSLPPFCMSHSVRVLYGKTLACTFGDILSLIYWKQKSHITLWPHCSAFSFRQRDWDREKLCVCSYIEMCIITQSTVYNKHIHLQFPSLIESRWKLASHIQNLHFSFACHCKLHCYHCSQYGEFQSPNHKY